MGEDLNGLSLDDLRSLQHKVSSSLDIVRARKVGFSYLYILRNSGDTTLRVGFENFANMLFNPY